MEELLFTNLPVYTVSHPRRQYC